MLCFMSFSGLFLVVAKHLLLQSSSPHSLSGEAEIKATVCLQTVSGAHRSERTELNELREREKIEEAKDVIETVFQFELFHLKSLNVIGIVFVFVYQSFIMQ